MTNSTALPTSMGSADRWENEGGPPRSRERELGIHADALRHSGGSGLRLAARFGVSLRLGGCRCR
jgi:hypothetical protein